MSGSRERELTLAVVADRPARIADRVAALRRLAGLRLAPLPVRVLRDVYLDVSGGELEERGLALRLRWSGDGPPVLALKGDRRRLPGGGVDRLELEGSWGTDAMEGIREALARAGVPADPVSDHVPPADPLASFRSAGWEVIQDRTTRRRVRRLRREGGRAAGELAVDEVRFEPAGVTAVHREVEVEAAPGEGLPAAAIEELRRRGGDRLRPWDHSKLATGRALARLLASGDPERWTAPDGSLGPAAYDRLAELLEGKTG